MFLAIAGTLLRKSSRGVALRRPPAGTDLLGIGRPKSLVYVTKRRTLTPKALYSPTFKLGEADVVNKIVSDLQNVGLSHTEAEIRQMSRDAPSASESHTTRPAPSASIRSRTRMAR